MSISVMLSQVLQLAPSARASYRDAIQNGQDTFDRFGISDNSLRVAHFMAQVMHESGGMTIQFENLNYSPERLPKVWPSRFRPTGPLDPVSFAHNPRKLANEVYGGRLGNAADDDGFTFRGRGLMQLTGRDSYAAATDWAQDIDPTAPDFTVDPDAMLDSQWCLLIAAAEWDDKGCNALADNDDIRAITKRINGGLTGLAERTDWSRRTKFIWH